MADADRHQRRMTGPGGARALAARWVVTGELVLETATHLGGGEAGDAVDMVVLRDRIDHRPLLTGSSLAGGLRSHLADLRHGYQAEGDAAAVLFGGREDGSQSPLIVLDARGHWPDHRSVEVRDGVAIAPHTGTADDHLKYDAQVLPPGTSFPVRFELLVGAAADEGALLQELSAALLGLERGDIGIGARTRRGLGRCHGAKWRARRFDLTTRAGWLAWLTSDHEHPNKGLTPNPSSAAALSAARAGLRLDPGPDLRDRVRIDVDLQAKGSLLVRSPGHSATAADATHLHSGGVPVLPGTSVAGALRARMMRIANIVRGDAERWTESMFGPRPDSNANPTASRLLVSEEIIEDGASLRQARIRSDRFTGGVVDGGLFDDEPNYRGRLRLRLELRTPRIGEVGLLLLVLKDLITGDLPLGGSASVGRGAMIGRAEVFLSGRDQPLRLDALMPAPPETIAELNRLVEEFRNAPAEAP